MMGEQINFFEEEQSLDQLTVKQLDQLGFEIRMQLEKCEAMKETLSTETTRLENLKAKMIAYLEHFGKHHYPIPGVGAFTIRERQTVTIPKDSETKKQFLQWLRSKGDEVYLTYVTVNHNTLQGIYNDEFETAVKEGRSGEFQIPGIGSPKLVKNLAVTKGKMNVES